MPSTEYSTICRAPLDLIWSSLREKILNPMKYLKQIKACEILEDTPNRIVRRMVAAMPAGDFTVVEDVLFDETTHLVDAVLVEHPSYTGNFIN